MRQGLTANIAMIPISSSMNYVAAMASRLMKTFGIGYQKQETEKSCCKW